MLVGGEFMIIYSVEKSIVHTKIINIKNMLRGLTSVEITITESILSLHISGSWDYCKTMILNLVNSQTRHYFREIHSS